MQEPVNAVPPSTDAQPDEKPARRPFARWLRPPGRLHRWGRKALKILLIAPIALYVGYLVLANLMLGTGLAAKLVSYNPDDANMHYDSAWSFWPGVVHVRGFRISGSDSVLQWMVGVDKARADVHFTALFKQKFYATNVRAEGYVLRVRLLVDPSTVTDPDDPRLKGLPSIPGFTNPPWAKAGPAKPELTDEDYNLWTAHVEDVDSTIREIWIQDIRYVGEGRVRGGFYFRPLRAVRVGPAALELRSGEIHIADQVIARLDADALITMNLFDPRNVTGLNVFETTVAQIKLDAQLPGLGFINDKLDPASGVRLADGSGELRADLVINRGVIEPGSALSIATSRLDVITPDLRATVGGEVDLRVSEEPGDRGAHLAVNVPRATLERPGKGLPPAVAEKVLASFTAPALNLLDLPSKVSAKLRVVAAAVPDLRWFNMEDAAPDAPKFTGGAAFFRGALDMNPEGRGSGTMRTLVKHGTMQWNGMTMRTDATADLTVDSADLFGKTASLRKSRVEVKDLVIKNKGEEWPSWWARVDIDKATVGQGLMEATIGLECKDAQPAVEMLDAQDIIPGWATGLLTMEGLKAKATVRKSAAGVDFKLLRATGGSLDIRGRLKKSEKSEPLGAFLVKSGILSVGIKLEKDGAGVHPLAGDDWVNEKMAALDR